MEFHNTRPLTAFAQEYRPEKSIVVCNELRSRRKDNILILPWRDFLEELWAGKIL